MLTYKSSCLQRHTFQRTYFYNIIKTCTTKGNNFVVTLPSITKRDSYMKISALFKEYIWLVNTIRRARRISLAELNDKWVETIL